jgi:hypothetical protein
MRLMLPLLFALTTVAAASKPTIVLEFSAVLPYDFEASTKEAHRPPTHPRALTVVVPQGQTAKVVYLSKPDGPSGPNEPLVQGDGASLSRSGDQLTGRLVTTFIRERGTWKPPTSIWSVDCSYTVDRDANGRWQGRWQDGERSGTITIIGWEEAAPTPAPITCLLRIEVEDRINGCQAIARFAADGSLESVRVETGIRRMSYYGDKKAITNHLISDRGELMLGVTVPGKNEYEVTNAQGSFVDGNGSLSFDLDRYSLQNGGDSGDRRGDPAPYQVTLTWTTVGGRQLMGSGTLVGNGGNRAIQTDGRWAQAVDAPAQAVTLDSLPDDLPTALRQRIPHAIHALAEHPVLRCIRRCKPV